jgi:hypothetical protein
VVVDVELTLNPRSFGFYRPAPNKLQLGSVRFALWRGLPKHALSFEINWSKTPEPRRPS